MYIICDDIVLQALRVMQENMNLLDQVVVGRGGRRRRLDTLDKDIATLSEHMDNLQVHYITLHSHRWLGLFPPVILYTHQQLEYELQYDLLRFLCCCYYFTGESEQWSGWCVVPNSTHHTATTLGPPGRGHATQSTLASTSHTTGPFRQVSTSLFHTTHPVRTL